MSELLTGAQILRRTLVDAGVDVMFGYPGGAIMPFYDALHGHEKTLRHILVRHEQAAAHAADGYARASGRVGVCVATSGPGATNLVTGLATAHMDGSPVLAITGQVGRPMLGRDAFQETDVVGVTMPVTKHNVLVRDVEELADDVREAMVIAMEGRPGPVLVDVPKDVQNQKAEYRTPRPHPLRRSGGEHAASPEPPSDTRLREVAQLIAQAERPLMMIGHGVIVSGAYAPVQELAERTGMPVITTLLGISAIPQAHPLHLGMPGMHGAVHINKAIQAADLIVGIGLRFDDRVTGNTATFAPRAKIVHIDIDAAAIGRNVPVVIGLVGDARGIVEQLLTVVAPRDCVRWQQEISGLMRHPEEVFSGGLSPDVILSSLAEVTGGKCTIVSDVGQHQMWVAQRYPFQRPNTHITSGGLGAMGFAVPAAMGVHVARPNEPVWAISGDGGFQMNMAEMATMVQEGLEVKLAIFNNGYLGMVRQWQQFFHGGRYSNTPIWSPDYVKLAEAYGIPGFRVKQGSEVADALRQANDRPGPALVELVLEQEANVFPMIVPGGSLSEPLEAAPV